MEVVDDECLRQLADERWYAIDILEDAYVGARRFVRRYSEARRFAEEVFRCLGM